MTTPKSCWTFSDDTESEAAISAEPISVATDDDKPSAEQEQQPDTEASGTVSPSPKAEPTPAPKPASVAAPSAAEAHPSPKPETSKPKTDKEREMEEYKLKLAEKRRIAREKAERDAEIERLKQEELQLVEKIVLSFEGDVRSAPYYKKYRFCCETLLFEMPIK